MKRVFTSVSVAMALHRNLKRKNALAYSIFLVRQKESEITFLKQKLCLLPGGGVLDLNLYGEVPMEKNFSPCSRIFAFK